MSPADLDGAVTIDVSAFHASAHAREDDPREVSARRLREELARPFAHVRVAKTDEGTVLGYCLFWHVVDELHLLNVAVAPSERRRGIGRALMDDLASYARTNGVAKVLLEVRRSNVPAINLYASLGFESFNVRSGYYDDGEDAVEMWLVTERVAGQPAR